MYNKDGPESNELKNTCLTPVSKAFLIFTMLVDL
jgi:hypothetical protein